MSPVSTETLVEAALAFPPVAADGRGPPDEDCRRDLGHPSGAAGAGRPARGVHQLDGDPGSEPVIVDTGTPANREQWMRTSSRSSSQRTFDGSSCPTTMSTTAATSTRRSSACPNATLVCNWAMVERHTNCFDFPLDRCRWVVDGESFDVGDRTLHAIRPPVFDSPTTRGPVRPDDAGVLGRRHVRDAVARLNMGVADLDEEFWNFGLTLFALGAVSPWISMDRPGEVRPASSTGRKTSTSRPLPLPQPGDRRPVHRAAFDRVRELPTLPEPMLPDQAVLDQIVAAMAAPG